MRKPYLTVAVVLFSLMESAQAQNSVRPVPPALQTNGCGSDISAVFVPDAIGECTFKEACEQHDLCYGKCLEGGSIFGTPACNDSREAKEARRLQCDDDFAKHITTINEGKCDRWAGVYRKAVRLAGAGSFNGMEATEIRRIIKSSESPEIAQARLDKIATLQQDPAVDKSTIRLNPHGDIGFDRHTINRTLIPNVQITPTVNELNRGSDRAKE